MKSTLNKNLISKLIFLLSFIMILPSLNFAQEEPARFIGYGGIYTGYLDNGSGLWEHNFSYPQGWFRYKIYPSELRYVPGGSARKFGVSIGVKNFTDAGGTNQPYFISSPGNNDLTFNVGDATGAPIFIKKIMKHPLPKINVNNHSLTYPPKSWKLFQLTPNALQVDSVDPNLPADEEIVDQFNYSCGITCTVHIYAYWDKDYSKILVYHYNFKNTGNVNSDAKIELPGQTLHGATFSWSYWPHLSWEGGIEVSGIYQNIDQNDNWWDYYGQSYKDYVGTGTPLNPAGNMSADSLRVQMWWDGNDGAHWSDNTGDPEVPLNEQTMPEKNPNIGQLLSSQYVGYGFLTVPVSTSDTTNDLSEPKTTTWVAYRNRPIIPPFKPEAKQAWYNIISSQEHALSPQDSGYTDPGQRGAIYGFTSLGPYEMPFGSEINATMVVGIYGMSYKDQIKYGAEYASGQMTDSQKDALLAKGRDSLLTTIGRYTRRYFTSLSQNKNPFSIPSPPPSPDINVTSGSKSISVSWSSESNNYILYRASGNAHRLIFDKVWEGNSTSYVDTAVQSGVPYYYAVVAVDDGSQNWDSPGEKLSSSFYANRTTAYPAVLTMQSEINTPMTQDTIHVQDTLAFSANVTGGLPPYQYQWKSSLQGMISDSASFKTDSLSEGTHNIYFTVTDSLGTISQDSIVVVVQNPTGINTKKSDMPKQFALAQNYPNPFNPSTTIKYSIPKSSKVVIDIYNTLGQKVRELVNGDRNPGYYETTWNGLNSNGEHVPSGIYIYRITAKSSGASSGFTMSKKMILLK